jgi:hypothetical protein
MAKSHLSHSFKRPLDIDVTRERNYLKWALAHILSKDTDQTKRIHHLLKFNIFAMLARVVSDGALLQYRAYPKNLILDLEP